METCLSSWALFGNNSLKSVILWMLKHLSISQHFFSHDSDISSIDYPSGHGNLYSEEIKDETQREPIYLDLLASVDWVAQPWAR